MEPKKYFWGSSDKIPVYCKKCGTNGNYIERIGNEWYCKGCHRYLSDDDVQLKDK